MFCVFWSLMAFVQSVGSTLANAKAWGPLQAIIKADFVSCFDTIDHTLLMVQQRRDINDESFLFLIKSQFLKTDIIDKNHRVQHQLWARNRSRNKGSLYGRTLSQVHHLSLNQIETDSLILKDIISSNLKPPWKIAYLIIILLPRVPPSVSVMHTLREGNRLVPSIFCPLHPGACHLYHPNQLPTQAQQVLHEDIQGLWTRRGTSLFSVFHFVMLYHVI